MIQITRCTFFLGRLWQQNVSVILGPVETCVHEVNNNQSQLAQALQELVVTHVQARMAAAFNLPMLSYYCQHAETSDKVAFPTFIRTRWEPREFFSTRYVCDQLRIIFEIFFQSPCLLHIQISGLAPAGILMEDCRAFPPFRRGNDEHDVLIMIFIFSWMMPILLRRLEILIMQWLIFPSCIQAHATIFMCNP